MAPIKPAKAKTAITSLSVVKPPPASQKAGPSTLRKVHAAPPKPRTISRTEEAALHPNPPAPHVSAATFIATGPSWNTTTKEFELDESCQASLPIELKKFYDERMAHLETNAGNLTSIKDMCRGVRTVLNRFNAGAIPPVEGSQACRLCQSNCIPCYRWHNVCALCCLRRATCKFVQEKTSTDDAELNEANDADGANELDWVNEATAADDRDEPAETVDADETKDPYKAVEAAKSPTKTGKAGKAAPATKGVKPVKPAPKAVAASVASAAKAVKSATKAAASAAKSRGVQLEESPESDNTDIEGNSASDGEKRSDNDDSFIDDHDAGTQENDILKEMRRRRIHEFRKFSQERRQSRSASPEASAFTSIQPHGSSSTISPIAMTMVRESAVSIETRSKRAMIEILEIVDQLQAVEDGPGMKIIVGYLGRMVRSEVRGLIDETVRDVQRIQGLVVPSLPTQTSREPVPQPKKRKAHSAVPDLDDFGKGPGSASFNSMLDLAEETLKRRGQDGGGSRAKVAVEGPVNILKAKAIRKR